MDEKKNSILTDLLSFDYMDFLETEIPKLTTEYADQILECTKAIEKLIKYSFEYIGEYFYKDPMGSTFSNDDHYVTLCYGHTEEECAEWCEKHGYKKSTSIFDGGYSVVKNAFYKKETFLK